MDRDFGLLDEFELTGKWWLPDNPTPPLYGTIKFKHNYIILEVSGIFSKKNASPLITSEIMHGLTNSNRKITLCQVSERYYEGASVEPGSNDNFGKSVFSCKYLFIGRHFSRLNDVKFTYINMNFTYLDKWINNTFECKRIIDDKYNINMESINYELNLRHIDSTLWISSIPTVLGDMRTDVKVHYTSNIGVKPNRMKNWDWFQELILSLKNLLTLFTGYPIYPISLSAQDGDCDLYEFVDIYYAVPNPLVFDNIYPRDFEISFQDLIKFPNRIVEDVINNWFKKIDIIGPVFDLFFLSFYDPSMKSHIRFLTLIQAIEIFHRRVCGGKYLNPKEYKPIRKALVDAIPNELDSELKDNLVSKIGSGNEFPLKTRLKRLRNYGPGAFKWFKMILEFETKDEEGFIGKLVDTRNHYTHWNESNCRPFFSDHDLDRINYELSLLLRIFLVGEIDSKGILSESKIFKSSMENLRHEKEILEFEKRQKSDQELLS